jgi:hypothetical protein
MKLPGRRKLSSVHQLIGRNSFTRGGAGGFGRAGRLVPFEGFFAIVRCAFIEPGKPYRIRWPPDNTAAQNQRARAKGPDNIFVWWRHKDALALGAPFLRSWRQLSNENPAICNEVSTPRTRLEHRYPSRETRCKLL